MIPAGVQGRNRGSPSIRRPTFSGWKASTSFSGRMASSTARLSRPLRQRQLHQDPVHVLPAVHLLHQRQQLLLGGFGGQMVVQAPHPALGAVLLLVADVYGAGGVVPHQNHRQTRLAGQGGGLLPQPLPHPDGQGLAV